MIASGLKPRTSLELFKTKPPISMCLANPALYQETSNYDNYLQYISIGSKIETE